MAIYRCLSLTSAAGQKLFTTKSFKILRRFLIFHQFEFGENIKLKKRLLRNLIRELCEENSKQLSFKFCLFISLRSKIEKVPRGIQGKKLN